MRAKLANCIYEIKTDNQSEEGKNLIQIIYSRSHVRKTLVGFHSQFLRYVNHNFTKLRFKVEFSFEV